MSHRIVLGVISSVALFVRAGEAGGTLKGTVDRSLRLAAKNGPYTIDGAVTIPAGITVAAGPGVELSGNAGSSLRVAGKLLLLGTTKRPVLVTGGVIACSFPRSKHEPPYTRFVAKHCKFSQGECRLQRGWPGSRALSGEIKDCTFDNCKLELSANRHISVVNCQFEGCNFHMSLGAKHCMHASVERCRFLQCRFALTVILSVQTCEFRECVFAGDALRIPRPWTVSGCRFCDKSWADLQECLSKASFPDQRLTVRLGPRLKDKSP